VPLRPDFSDLKVKVTWLRNNPVAAARIAGAGRRFLERHFGRFAPGVKNRHAWEARETELGCEGPPPLFANIDTTTVRIQRHYHCSHTSTPPLFAYSDTTTVRIQRYHHCSHTATPPLFAYSDTATVRKHRRGCEHCSFLSLILLRSTAQMEPSLSSTSNACRSSRVLLTQVLL
jgi:hypothetical protein